MPLFGHKDHRDHDDHDEAWPSPENEIPGFAQVAASQGWRPAGERPFGGQLEHEVHEISRRMFGVPRSGPTAGWLVQGTTYHDAYTGSIDGRMVVVANAWLPIGPNMPFGWSGIKGTAVCAVEMPGMLPVQCIQPRQFPAPVQWLARPTGDPAFDERFITYPATPELLRKVIPELSGLSGPEDMLTPEVRQRIMARDDWVFQASSYWLGCLQKGAFRTVDAVTQRIAEVMAIVAAIPTSIMPDHVDHSADDIVARFAALDSPDQALAALEALTPQERDQLRRSDSPLADFADVRTPLEAMAKLQEMDPQRRLQLLAMFQRVTGEN